MSCDTFVALPPATKGGCVIFGKNSDRPASEVQEVVYLEAKDHGTGSNVQCTYIEIDQVSRTHAVILSKPAWMWGAEMGSNEHGVCIGNEAVWTKMASDEDKVEKLLGMDLVRLGLERSTTSKEALDVITSLLEKHGQGGPCYEDPEKLDCIYHNSFIIADGEEAWVLETVSNEWAAEKVTEGVRNISNMLSITTKIDLCSPGLKDVAKAKGFWNGEGELDFAQAFKGILPSDLLHLGSETPQHRYSSGKHLMNEYMNGKFDTQAMMTILRDEESGICRLGKGGSATMASQVSMLSPAGSGKPGCHWFTGTPNPARSLFKPFVFTPNVIFPSFTVSPTIEDDPAKSKPRFQRTVDRRHVLYSAHQAIEPLDADSAGQNDLRDLLFELEAGCVREMEDFVANFNPDNQSELDELFKDAVESEVKFYPREIKLN